MKIKGSGEDLYALCSVHGQVVRSVDEVSKGVQAPRLVELASVPWRFSTNGFAPADMSIWTIGLCTLDVASWSGVPPSLLTEQALMLAPFRISCKATLTWVLFPLAKKRRRCRAAYDTPQGEGRAECPSGGAYQCNSVKLAQLRCETQGGLSLAIADPF